MGVLRRDTALEYQVAKSLPFSAHRPLTAAAVKLNLRDKTTTEILQRRRAASPWQQDAWEYYDSIGEIKYAYKLFTNVLSRIRLFPAFVEDEDETPIPLKSAGEVDDATKKAVQKAMRRVFSGANQSEILRKAGINMLVAGECYLVQLPAKYGVREKEMWKIISIDELEQRGGKTFLKTEKGQRPSEQEEIPSTNFVGRIWNEHARYSDEADSAMRALVDVCDEFFLFQRAARATARSRLNAGALLVPDTLSAAADTIDETPEDLEPGGDLLEPIDDVADDEFEDELVDSMTTPVSDEGSAASIVPLIIRGPRDDLKEVRLIKFERSFDPQLAQRAERALERILQGIDLPKDIVTGLANIKYSNAVQIEESLYTAHIEPLVLMLCDVFRTVYLVPALELEGVDPDLIEQLVIWYDPSAIMTAPDKSSAANVGHDKLILSDDAWRRSNGFADTDAPTNDELAVRLALTRGSLSEEVTTAIFRRIFPEILDAARNASQAANPSPLPPGVQDVLDGGPRPPESPSDQPAGGPPATPGAQPPGATPGLPPIVTDENAPPTAPPV